MPINEIFPHLIPIKYVEGLLQTLTSPTLRI